MELEDDLLSADEDMDRGTYNIFCLATQLSRESAPAFVEDFRRRIERNLGKYAQELSGLLRAAYASVQATYRKIVLRPEVPSLSLFKEPLTDCRAELHLQVSARTSS